MTTEWIFWLLLLNTQTLPNWANHHHQTRSNIHFRVHKLGICFDAFAECTFISMALIRIYHSISSTAQHSTAMQCFLSLSLVSIMKNVNSSTFVVVCAVRAGSRSMQCLPIGIYQFNICALYVEKLDLNNHRRRRRHHHRRFQLIFIHKIIKAGSAVDRTVQIGCRQTKRYAK